MHQVVLYDTTLRDGSQREGISFSVEDKIRIAKCLDEFGIRYIEGGWPGSNPKDIAFFERVAGMTFENAVITAFGSTRRANTKVEDDANLKAILDCGVKAAAIFGKSWDFQVTKALRTTFEENLRMIGETVGYLKSKGLEVIYDAEHFFDGFRSNPDYALKTLRAAYEAGADAIVLCDTNGGSIPGWISSMTREVIEKLSPSVPIGIHAHNDSGLAVANSLAAVEAGATHVQGTINGYGERCGNADLCSVIPNLQLKMGIPCIDQAQLARLTEVSRFVSELANLSPGDHQPYVGRSAFAHKGGIHVSALMRHPETYEHVNPGVVGNKRRVLVSELSGASNVVYKAREYNIDLESDKVVLRKVLDEIKSLEHNGFYFEGAEASFELILKKAAGLYRKCFDLVGFRLIIEKRSADEEPMAEATIKVRVGDRVLHTAADGNGPVNALDNALRKALEEVYPDLKDIKLTDYKVRVLDEKSGTGARVRVLIESSDDGRSWGTVGVSTNIIEASWQALVDSIEYGLLARRAACDNSE